MRGCLGFLLFTVAAVAVLGFVVVQVAVPARAGDIYEIAIWEYEFPGVEFELRTALQ